VTDPHFQPLSALAVLVEHGVQFVLIGGLAGRALGSPTVTNDVDICYARDPANLEALASALGELHSRPRGAPEDAPFVLDARTLEMGDRFTFSTDAGSLDILGTVEGVSGFDELNQAASDLDLGGFVVRVASIDDLIRMKRAAGRPKDLIEVEVLGALRDEIDAQNLERRRKGRG
jgi:predicted nucleotidyltransferase